MRDGALKGSLSFPRTSYPSPSHEPTPRTYRHFQGIQRNFIPYWETQILSAACSFNHAENKYLNVTHVQIKRSAKAYILKNNA